MKRTRTTVRATLVLSVVAIVAVLAPGALAASNAAVGTLPSSVPAGATTSYSFTLRTTGGSASSFNLTAPTGWSISSVDSSSQAGVTRASASQIQGRSISASSNTTLTVSFTAQAPCSATSTAWTLAVRSGPNFNGSSIPNDASSALSTALSGACSAAFSRGPADAAFVGTTAPNITSAAYNQTGDAIQVLVSDANGQPRSGISVQLNFNANPTSATLTAPTVSSGTDGKATFSPVTISKSGLNYQLIPNGGTGVTGTASGFFGVYQDEQACGSCTAHGNSSTIHSTVTANSTNGGTLAVLVSGVAADFIDCGPTIPSGYDYKPVSSEVTSWQYTGNGAQTLVVDIDRSLIKKILNRGSSHIDFCYQADNGKTFTDKFGNVGSGPGLLSDCGPGITNNCIVSETGDGQGGRLITVTVDDGKGRP
jgi:hypothetical protein